MLRYLLLIVFFISFRLCSYAQKEKWDSTYLQHFVDSTHTIPADVDLSTLHLYKGTFINSSYGPDTSWYYKKDTIRCLLLVSDSSNNENNKAVWIRGYWVYGYNDLRVIYLDAIKQPLQKSIIVWQAKEY